MGNEESKQKMRNKTSMALNFLDEKINDLIDRCQSEMSAINTRLDSVIAQLKLNAECVDSLAQNRPQVDRRLSSIESSLDSKTSKEDNAKCLDDCMNLVKVGLDEVYTKINQINEKAVESDHCLERCDKNISKLELDIDDVENLGLSLKSELKELERTTKSAMDCLNEDREQLKQLVEAADSQFKIMDNDVKRSYENMANIKSDVNRQLRTDINAIKEAINELAESNDSLRQDDLKEFSKFKDDLTPEIQLLQHQVLKLIQKSESERGILEGVKQVVDNARKQAAN